MRFSKSGLTLVELMISIALLIVIILAATTFDTAIRQSFRHSDIQARLLNEVSPALAHLAKNIMQGIGTTNQPGIDINVPNRRIRVRLDINNTPANCSDDRWVYYVHQTGQREIRFCPNSETGCVASPIWPCATSEEVIARQIINIPGTDIFSFVDSNGDGNADNRDNLVAISITACQDPDGVPDACGTTKNPAVNLSTQVSISGKSVN